MGNRHDRRLVRFASEDHRIGKTLDRELSNIWLLDAVHRTTDIRETLNQCKYFVRLIEESVREICIAGSIPFDSLAQVTFGGGP